MWFRYLEQWNGISFFIDDNFITASDYDLFTDASSNSLSSGNFANMLSVSNIIPKYSIEVTGPGVICFANGTLRDSNTANSICIVMLAS
jgi:hypothetical protein